METAKKQAPPAPAGVSPVLLAGLNRHRQRIGGEWLTVAADLGITISTLYAYRTGRRRPGLANALKIAKRLDIDIRQILPPEG